ncbi:MAG: DUF4233 domain-containing protein [Actinomycetota bacterium]|nr:DUF4233 domain-containing protein [Actinomycetota bacterium]
MTAPDPTPEAPAPRPPDPERGLRGAISATLVLEAITVLLAIPVAKNTGNGTGSGGVIAIVVLALAMMLACMFVSKPIMTAVVTGLQVLTIAGWAISAPLGVIGVLFAVVFAFIFYFRYEYRRRAAAGELPGQRSR